MKISEHGTGNWLVQPASIAPHTAAQVVASGSSRALLGEDLYSAIQGFTATI
jgi:hypothetical protein